MLSLLTFIQYSIRSLFHLKKWILTLCLFNLFISAGYSEGSGDWGIAANRQSWLWYPAGSGAGGFVHRGYFLLPSTVSNYEPGHRLLVYVKAGETVFWGFRRHGSSGNLRVRWYYDATDTGFFPSGTSGSGRTMISTQDYNANANGAATGRPGNATAARNGPSQVTGAGYTGYSFVNTTGADRAFWVEITNTSNNHITSGFNINFWDVTVASGSPGSYTEIKGRVYSRFWSTANSRINPSRNTMTLTKGTADSYSFHDDFGFYVPVDNTFTAAGDDYFVKRITFGGSSGGWTNFFANKDGPRNTLSFEENRRSIPGTSSNFQYALFINDPDPTIWKTTPPPSATLDIEYREKAPPGVGGEATVNVTVSLPATVDILIDLNGNQEYDEGEDILLFRQYDSPGSYEIYWDGEDASGNIVPADTDVEVIATVVFFPVHFPIFDLEQSLGMKVTNVRPGAQGNDKIFWDDSLIPRTGIVPPDSPQSIAVNTTGVLSPDHIWWATGDNGFSNNITINTWAGSYYTEVRESFRILPVQWLYFRGKSLENRIRLEWATAMEKDNEGFTIQRSKNIRQWTDIAFVKGQGNSEAPVFYEEWDANPLIGPNYYRLKQNDYDGTEDYSSVIRVDFIPDWEIHLFPNPASDKLYVQSKEIQSLFVYLMDAKGAKIDIQPVFLNPDKLLFDIGPLSAGMYMVYVQKEDKSLVKKILKR